jgi:hypothetical protein
MTFSSQTFDRFALFVCGISLLAALPLAAAMFIGQSI